VDEEVSDDDLISEFFDRLTASARRVAEAKSAVQLALIAYQDAIGSQQAIVETLIAVGYPLPEWMEKKK